MIAVTICWLLLSLALVVGMLDSLSPALAAEAFVSILCGPFAFFSGPSPFQVRNFVIALLCLASIGLHAKFRTVETAFIACAGVSFWFFLGMAFTFIGI
jgi:hypothetical protein